LAAFFLWTSAGRLNFHLQSALFGRFEFELFFF
jgi:hypothetical protein